MNIDMRRFISAIKRSHNKLIQRLLGTILAYSLLYNILFDLRRARCTCCRHTHTPTHRNMKLLQSLPGLGTSCSKMLIGNRYSIIQKRGPTKLLINGIRYNSSKVEPSKIDDRLHRLIKKSKFLTRLNGNPRYKHYFDKLSEAGAVSTMTSFLVLHEITAIVPLFALWGLLYNLDPSDQYEMPVYFKDLLNKCGESIGKLIGDYDNGWDRDRLVVSGALAYAIVKVLYPARILFSLWAAPYVGTFVIMPFTKLRALIRR